MNEYTCNFIINIMKISINSLFVAFFFVLISVSCKEQGKGNGMHSLTVQIEGIDYDSLFIYRFSKGDFEKLKIAGEKQAKGIWNFSIPDTVYDNLVDFELIPQTFDYTTNTSSRMLFQQEINGELRDLQQLNFNESLTFIQLKYKEEVIYDSICMASPNGDFVWGKMKRILFTLEEPKDNSDFLLRMDDPFYSMFLNKDTLYSYEKFYEQYLAKARQNPDSRYYISRLATQLNSYKTKDDVRRIYDCFNDKQKQSVFGRKIQTYLNEPVTNEILENAQTGRMEFVIPDTMRYTLLLFSASWCNPCHKQLPLQKKLYENLHGKLNMVTISIDEQETVEKWKSFVAQEAIPWRTMLCKDTEYIRNRYKVPAIPHCKLVFPGLKDMVAFDLWNENEVNRLYELFGVK